MQSTADKEFQQNVMNFKRTLQRKATWEELEAYVGYKLEKGGRFKAFILSYLNRDFEPLDFDDGQQYYCTQKVCTWWGGGYLNVCRGMNKKGTGKKEYHAAYYMDNKDAIKKRQATYRKNNKDVIARHRATYFKNNKETILKRQTEYFKKNVAE